MTEACHLVDLLELRFAADPSRVLYEFDRGDSSGRDRRTYGELRTAARKVAATLRAAVHEGDRVILMYPPGLGFFEAFFGCMYAGVIAVPLFPPPRSGIGSKMEHFVRVVSDARARACLAPGDLVEDLRSAGDEHAQLRGIQWISHESTRAVDEYEGCHAGASDVAFLQYTSGSVSAPKGVMVSHANLLANLDAIHHISRLRRGDAFVSWLPHEHDMGLIGCGLYAPFADARAVLMAPSGFIRSPLRWLTLCSEARAPGIVAPDFAYRMCVDRTTPEQRAKLDLGSIRVALCGAEPVRAETMHRFAEAFAGCGFRDAAFRPVYGLAESTLLASGGGEGYVHTVGRFSRAALGRDRVEEVDADCATAVEIVGCGPPSRGQELAIVNPVSRRRCLAGEVGEIWISGPSVAQGYWGNEATTREAFHNTLEGSSGSFLRTGDLGFFRGGELYVTGRLKDLLIVRGQKLHPTDIESTAQAAHPSAAPGGGAAFLREDGDAGIVVVQEAISSKGVDAKGAAMAIATAVARAHEVSVRAVAIIPPRAIPRTTSGKVRRQATRTAFDSGRMPCLFVWEMSA
jgi:acyl-CoA synthetase (AMP-forming)/AMP-acid ligase II